MNFNSIGGRDYSQAGKAVANDAIRSFAASRRNSPNFGKMAQEAANIRSNEKRAMTKLSARTVVDGINAKSRVARNEVTVEAEEGLRNAKRKAGVLAAGGKFFGQASTFMGDKRKKRTVGDSDEFFDNAIERVRTNAKNRADQLSAFTTSNQISPSNSNSSSSSSNSSSPSSSSSATTAAPSSGDQWDRWGKVISFAEGTSGENGYTTMFTGSQFTDTSRHPRQINRGGGYSSDAAGKYQFLSTTWDGAKQALNLPDFSPASQEKAGRYLAENRGLDVNAEIRNIDDFRAQIDKIAPEWAGLPYSGKGKNGGGYGTSYYGQGGKSIEQLWEVWNGGL